MCRLSQADAHDVSMRLVSWYHRGRWAVPYLVPALNELDGDLLPRGDVFGQLHESKGASVEVCDLRGSDRGMLNPCAC